MLDGGLHKCRNPARRCSDGKPGRFFRLCSAMRGGRTEDGFAGRMNATAGRMSQRVRRSGV